MSIKRVAFSSLQFTSLVVLSISHKIFPHTHASRGYDGGGSVVGVHGE